MLIAAAIISAIVGFVCGAVVGKRQTISRTQALVLWIMLVALGSAAAFFLTAGSPIVIMAVFMLMCVGELLGLLLFTARLPKN